MLHSKISKAWYVCFVYCICACLNPYSVRSELPPHQHSTLRVELFNAILRFSNGPRLVLTRLCVALVLYAFHALPTVWPNALVSIVQTLRGASLQVSRHGVVREK